MYNRFSKTVALVGLLALGLTACEKDEVKVTSEFAAPPTLTPSSTNAGVLVKPVAPTPAATAVTYAWAPYSIKTSNEAKVVSTVTYTLQFAKAGTNFATVSEVAAGTDMASSMVFKAPDLNRIFLALKLPFGQASQLDVRLKTFVAGNQPVLYSPTVQISATPYDDCSAPNSDTWGLVGPAGNGWPVAPPAPQTDMMLKWDCAANAYVLRTALGVGDFKLRQNQGWTINLGALAKPIVPGTAPVTLKLNGEDMTVSAAGTYTVKLTVTGSGANVTAGTLTVTP